jgi:hypothetical protein
VPPHRRLTPSSRIVCKSQRCLRFIVPRPLTLVKQCRLWRYLSDAPVACILVFMLSKGIVASVQSACKRSQGQRSDVHTVMNPAPAPTTKVPVEDSFPDAGFVQSTAACCRVAYDEKRTALLAPCFMICSSAPCTRDNSATTRTHGRSETAIYPSDAFRTADPDRPI